MLEAIFRWVVDWLAKQAYPDVEAKLAAAKARRAEQDAALQELEAAETVVRQAMDQRRGGLAALQLDLNALQDELGVTFGTIAKAKAENARLAEATAAIEADNAEKRAVIDALSPDRAVRIDL